MFGRMIDYNVAVVNSRDANYVDLLEASAEDAEIFGVQDKLEDYNFAKLSYSEFDSMLVNNKDRLSSEVSNFSLEDTIEELVYSFPAGAELYMPESSRKKMEDFMDEHGMMPLHNGDPESQEYFKELGDLLSEDMSDQNKLDRFEHRRFYEDLEVVWSDDLKRIDYNVALRAADRSPDTIHFLKNLDDFRLKD